MESLLNIQPISPVAPYLGGKRNLAKRLIHKISEQDHKAYIECFMGMGGVFFKRDMKPKAEIINDLNGEVANFFRILQRHYVAFMDMLKFQITTRSTFERLKDTDPTSLTDLERAARFLYLQRLSFGGKIAGQALGVDPLRSARFDVTKLAPLLEAVFERLSGVVVECLPYEKLIERYDRPVSLFYLDPPYWGCENDYGKDLFSRDKFEDMANLLANIKGHFILSINDVPQIRHWCRHFNIEEVQTTYTVSKSGAQKVSELIISN